MNLQVSMAGPADAEALAAILRGWIYETCWMPKLHEPHEDHAFVAHLIRTQAVHIARLEDRPAGFLAQEGAEITCLYLAPLARGQGIGTRLLDLAKTASNRLDLWTFQANDGARRFYARHGFAEIERTSGAGNAEGLPDLRLRWDKGA